jgi:hypothetical protein
MTRCVDVLLMMIMMRLFFTLSLIAFRLLLPPSRPQIFYETQRQRQRVGERERERERERESE